MTISWLASGSTAEGSTSLSVPIPAGVSDGDLLVCCIANKYPSNGPSTPSGWILGGQASGGSGSPGGTSGDVYITLFYRECDGTETGNLAVTLSGSTKAVGFISHWSKTADRWAFDASPGGSDNSPGTSWSVNAGAVDMRPSDFVIFANGFNRAFLGTTSGDAFSASGITFSSSPGNFGTNGAFSPQVGFRMVGAAVASGTADTAITYQVTGTLSSTDSPAGGGVALRLRELNDYNLAIGQGSYGLTGQDVTLRKAWRMPIDHGSYALTGQAVDLLKGWKVAMDQGSYTLTGQDVAFAKGRTMVVETGFYGLSGQDVRLLHHRLMEMESGDYAIAGQNVSLIYSPSLDALAGKTFNPGQLLSEGITLEPSPLVLADNADAGEVQARKVDGINSHNTERWQLRWTIVTADVGDAIWTFLRAREGLIPFYWTPPREETAKKYVVTDLKRRHSGLNQSISCEFRRVFDHG